MKPPARRRSLTAAALIVGGAVALSLAPACGSDAVPPLQAGPQDGSVTTDGSGGPDADARSAEGGSGGDASIGDGAADAAKDGAPDGAVDAGPPVCDPTATWKAGIAVPSVSTPDPDWLGSITPDELTIAWTSVVNGAPVVHYADRTSTTVPFGTTNTVDPALTSIDGGAPIGFALDRVALSADGLRLVAARADRHGFFQIVRTSRSGSFDQDSSGDFRIFGPPSGEGPPGPPGCSAPLLSADDQLFLYTSIGTVDAYSIYQSHRAPDGHWPLGAPLADASLMSQGGVGQRATGLSADARTLFLLDDTTGHERAGWRNDPWSSFTMFVDLGSSHSYAAPNASCDRLYYSDLDAADAGADAASQLDLYSADKQ